MKTIEEGLLFQILDRIGYSGSVWMVKITSVHVPFNHVEVPAVPLQFERSRSNDSVLSLESRLPEASIYLFYLLSKFI